MRGKKTGCRRWARYHYFRVVRLEDSPEKVAAGFAFGVFVGIFPTFGLGIIIAVLASGILRINKAAAIIGSMVMNPWTSPFFWALSFMSGSIMMGYGLDDTMVLYRRINSESGAWKAVLGTRLLVPYIIGNIFITMIFAAASYFGVRWSARLYRDSKKRKWEERQGRLPG